MIKHVRHAGIDRRWWDAQLLRCSNRSWYAQSWVLDAACPGWQALVDEASGAVMPLTCRRKWGIDYLYQPFGLQQLGVFGPALNEQLVAEFIAAIPGRFRYADICLNHPLSTTLHHDRLIERHDHVLVLDKEIGALRSGYSEGHRRNIRKAAAASLDAMNIGPQEFVSLFERTTAARFGGIDPADRKVLHDILAEAVQREQCTIAAYGHGGAIAAAQCIVRWEGRLILFKSAVTEEGLETRALFRLVDDAIAANASSGLLLDFA
ncbi:MAG: GNAT family N-acetyltransferase [Flavobacteriales bacterium]|nr:GNAT family N-acetyltransferase [Flavobacteriales bacterium]